jgi:thiosulfate/3-mercaptopyruvate sulfurtransferase
MKREARSGALVDPEWVGQHRGDSRVHLIEIAGLGQDDRQAYRAGHVPGALCWDWKEMLWDPLMREFPSPDEFARRLGAAGIDHDSIVVFYGEPVQFGVYAWWTFSYCGHPQVKLLDGGRHRWQAEGRALEQDVPAARAPVSCRAAARNETLRMGRDEVLAGLGQSGRVVLDGRSIEEYSGQRVGAPGSPDIGALRYGRVPGARHLMFEELLKADKSFRPVAELRAAVEARGVTPDCEIVTYCRMSHRATVLYFVLTQLLGYGRVRVYDGSWTEWGNLVGVPVER